MGYEFPVCRSVLSEEGAKALFARLLREHDGERRSRAMDDAARHGQLPAFFPDLFRLEELQTTVSTAGQPTPSVSSTLAINSTLQLLSVDWAGLDGLLRQESSACQPAPGTFIMVWRCPDDAAIRVQQACEADLLALKVLAEELSEGAIAAQGRAAVGLVDAAIRRAVELGILLRPPSALRRHFNTAYDPRIHSNFLSTEVFSLQWHITQACDLHCKHCYDRSSRAVMPKGRAMAVLDDFREFCQERFVRGQVTFTGGNPLLYPHFLELYQAAVERGLGVAILGNPASRHELETLIDIAKPLFYQVSLEGLAAHNDDIRGPGHFTRVMDFLAVLKELGVYSMVMLTLSRDNQAQVLPLAELLRDKVDLFTFNRLAMVGEASNLPGPEVGSYQHFLQSFLAAAQDNPCLGLKDNLFNILTSAGPTGEVFGGCAGHGCGAAFNFVSVLADGEVHACRKFPSAIGNIFTDTLAAIYDSAQAEAYRQGSVECQGCRLRPVCGGCLAVVHGLGLDPLQVRDPYCWHKIE